MKKALIFGEFLEKSSTGIAYINSNLKNVLRSLDYSISVLHEPRTKDYSNKKSIIKKNINIRLFLKLFFKILNSEKADIAFMTISLGNIGLIKSLIIQYLIKMRSEKLYLYIHRGDLDIHSNKSIYKNILINIILNNSYRIVLLSKRFYNQKTVRFFRNKIITIPNALNKNDTRLSKQIYKKRTNFYKQESDIINFLFLGNIEKNKGIFNIIEAIRLINNSNFKFKIKLDLYGMMFESINSFDKFINYKGKLNNKERLLIMSQYDFLITASISEGMPLTIIECLAIGLPFITTNVGAIQDLLFSDYPYITKSDSKSIFETVKLTSNDFMDKKNYLNKIISKSNDLYIKKFQYKQFYECIKQNI